MNRIKIEIENEMEFEMRKDRRTHAQLFLVAGVFESTCWCEWGTGVDTNQLRI